MSRLFSRAAYFPAREKELPRAESRSIARAGERNLMYGGSFFARATALPAAKPRAPVPSAAPPAFPAPPRSFRARCTPPPAHCRYPASLFISAARFSRRTAPALRAGCVFPPPSSVLCKAARFVCACHACPQFPPRRFPSHPRFSALFKKIKNLWFFLLTKRAPYAIL